jgi:hypothetical protein
MTTFNVFVKTIGIIFFLIFLELIYKLTIYNRGSFFITNGIEGKLLLTVSTFMSFLLSIFLIRLRSKNDGIDIEKTKNTKIRIIKYIFIFFGVYSLYESIMIFANPWTWVLFMELNLSVGSLVILLNLISFIIKPIIYFSVPHLINKNYRWSIWLSMASLLLMFYPVYKAIETFYTLRFHPFDSFSILPSYSTILFPVVIIILSIFSIIALYSLRKNVNLVTRN